VVKRNIRETFRRGIHTEVTMLIIPGYNDDEELFKQNISFLAEISRDIPLHISRFFPHYKMKDVPPTPKETLTHFYNLAREELNYVYVGNLPDPKFEITYCPNCGNPVIIRHGYSVENRLEGDRCPYCGYKIHGVFEKKKEGGSTSEGKD
jgi:pyruvate formate lyase activating enzyme